jgi:hypothetical protein
VTPTGSVKAVTKRLRQSLSNSKLLNLTHSNPPREQALRHWSLLRMHFLDYAREARRLTRDRWYQAVDAALLQVRAGCFQIRCVLTQLGCEDWKWVGLRGMGCEVRSGTGGESISVQRGHVLESWRTHSWRKFYFIS